LFSRSEQAGSQEWREDKGDLESSKEGTSIELRSGRDAFASEKKALTGGVIIYGVIAILDSFSLSLNPLSPLNPLIPDYSPRTAKISR
jgi:hypothetical protein